MRTNTYYGVDSDRSRAFADQIVDGLMAAALDLASAASMLPEGPAADRVGAAADAVDRMLQQVRSFMVESRIGVRPRS